MDQIAVTPPMDVVDTLTEHCDRCGAAAKLHLTLAEGTLAFCGHHANALAGTIVEAAVRIVVLDEFIWVGASAAGTPGEDAPATVRNPRAERSFRNSR